MYRVTIKGYGKTEDTRGSEVTYTALSAEIKNPTIWEDAYELFPDYGSWPIVGIEKLEPTPVWEY